MSAATAPAERPGERARLRTEANLAGRVLAPQWPLETFIAVNPLGGLEDRPFESAVAATGEILGARGVLDEAAFRAAYAQGRIAEADLRAALARRHPDAVAAGPVRTGDGTVGAVQILLRDLLDGEPAPPPVRTGRTLAETLAPDVAATVDAQSAKWCAAYLDAGQAAWAMPGRERGFHAAWRELAPLDRTLPRPAREALTALAERPDDALLDALAALGIREADRQAYLQAHLARQPGWAGHVRWRGERGAGIDLVSLLAMRITYEAVLLEDAGHAMPGWEVAPDPGAARATPSAADRAARVAEALGLPAGDASVRDALARRLERLPVEARPFVWLEAYEGHYRDELLARLARPAATTAEPRPAAQLVCCIDARSEGLRRHLEALGPYATLGFAGFFAVAISYQDLAGGAPSALCPVLLEPRHRVREAPVQGGAGLAERAVAGRRALASAEAGFEAPKEDLAGPFALAEVSGWLAGPLAAAKTLGTGVHAALRERLHRRAVPDAPTHVPVEEAFSAEERVLFAEVALTMMGLVDGFGRLVVLCGHGSRTENNPYEAALDCGACGGNAGGPNARTAAAILNGADVRAALAERGIAIPADTVFVAGEHDTASDRVELLDRHLVPASHREELDRLAGDLGVAGARLSAERCATLPGAPAAPSPRAAARHVRGRGADWAQVFPEWGLAGNAAFVVGPRSMTRGIDLERRAFLHSYEAGADPHGTALETILTAPLVVAQWINCQYYFSTVDPEHFGSGTKTIHNVVGAIGVLSGHAGDLQPGLPWQSVADGERLVHEPMRLLAVVQAPLERIDGIIGRNTILQHLFGHDWVALAAREHQADPWKRRTPHGWEPWTIQEERA